jgi:hypothetical protein
LDDQALERRLRAYVPPKPPTYICPDFAHVHQEMKRGSMTLQLLWEEYPLGAEGRCYQYTSFCTHYREGPCLLLQCRPGKFGCKPSYRID